VIGAALGMRYEDLIDEYEFTGLSIWGVRSRNYQDFQAFLKRFMDLPGMTLQEKAHAFLMQYAGITRDQIAAIEEILVEKDGKE
jgi:hypothetical protein